MPSIPEEQEKCGDCSGNPNVTTVREVTQTDHLNKKLLSSYLKSINMSNGSDKNSNGASQEEEQEEEQNWES